ncbi:winged helix DNA-binding domain-containing protein [Streptomyces sp. NBC_00536]|uniref:winged helix DNA-binding domain-containing protein n=1 Tax=Streptomyces sp. NBC_00536 TaxID=2975769 RepID=UPI002E821FDF|nr:winged helix DNA-binding domain-containing protein [Streptomyces sp. NBC_00536]WUC82084.1 winged helix DNA-binding domain-containing protein [Streptomyces sp. NBC_00536]
MASSTSHRADRAAPVLGVRALNRATLARQLLLARAECSARDAVTHLIGLQAQNVKPPYYQLHARLRGFRPEELAGLMESRQVVRMVTMRSTIHTHTAEDALTLRPLVQPARDREIGNFRKGLVGVDLQRLARLARAFVDSEPRTMAEIRTELLAAWPDADPASLAVAARCKLPLVQVTPRGVWGRAGQVRLTTLDNWLRGGGGGRGSTGCDASPPAASVDEVVLRYLGAFGPASVKDMQVWAGLTRLREAFERLRPGLLVFRDENGVELFDLPDAPRPDPGTHAPPRFLPEFDNLLLSHADRSRVIPAHLKGRTWRGNQAYCTLLVDGFVAGVWKMTETGLVVELFTEVSGAQRQEIVGEGELLLDGMRDGAAGEGPGGGVCFGAVTG